MSAFRRSVSFVFLFCLITILYNFTVLIPARGSRALLSQNTNNAESWQTTQLNKEISASNPPDQGKNMNNQSRVAGLLLEKGVIRGSQDTISYTERDNQVGGTARARNRAQQNFTAPKLVIAIPTIPRHLENNETVLLKTLESLLVAMDECAGLPELDIMVLVVNTSPMQHEAFENAFLDERFQTKPWICFLKIDHNRVLLQSSAYGHTIGTMPEISSISYQPPAAGVLTEFPALFHDPGLFLKGWENWPNQILNGPKERQQTANYLSMLHYSSKVFPNADILLWEDDCLFCPSALAFIFKFLMAAGNQGTPFGMLRAGYGASGILLHHLHVVHLIPFAYGLMFSSNIDVALYKYFSFFRLPHYMTTTVQSLHRGFHSTLTGLHQKDMVNQSCSDQLKPQWGSFGECQGVWSVFQDVLLQPNIKCSDAFNF